MELRSAPRPPAAAITTRVLETSSGPCCNEPGLTRVLLTPDDDARVLEFGLGLTDLAKSLAASSDIGLESHYDIDALVAKIERFAPAWLAFHGKTAGKEASNALGHGSTVSLGEQRWTIGTTAVFVLPSASAANRDPKRLEGRASRADWFRELATPAP